MPKNASGDRALTHERRPVAGAVDDGRRLALAATPVDDNGYCVPEERAHLTGGRRRRPAVKIGAGRGQGANRDAQRARHGMIRTPHADGRRSRSIDLRFQVMPR